MNFDVSVSKEYFDIPNAAAFLGVAAITVRRLVAQQMIEHLRVGPAKKRILFTQTQLENYQRNSTHAIAA